MYEELRALAIKEGLKIELFGAFMKITFDSNVFQSVVEPSPSLSDFKDFFLVKEAIKSNKISPFISESIFCLEALNNDDRQPFINNIKHNYRIRVVLHTTTCNTPRIMHIGHPCVLWRLRK